MLRYVNVCL